ETLPYFIAFAALDKSDLLPVGLDFFHQWSGLFKIVTVLMRFGYFYQLEFLLEILVLLFFSVLVKLVLFMAKVTRRLFKGIPGFLIVFAGNLSDFKKSFPKVFVFLNPALGLTVR